MPVEVRARVQPRRDARFAQTSDGRPLLIRATPEDTGGRLQVVEMFEPFRPRVQVHVHDYAEAWYIVAGNYGFYNGGVWHRADAGTLAYAPPGLPHAIAALPGTPCQKVSVMMCPDSSTNANPRFAMDPRGTIDVPWRTLLVESRLDEKDSEATSLGSAARDWLIDAEHLFDVDFVLDVPTILDGEGTESLMVVQTLGGRFSGAECRGVVRSATDWAQRSEDGVVAVDIRAVLEFDDGSPMLLQQRGVGVRESGELTILAEGRLQLSSTSALRSWDGIAVTALGRVIEGGVAYSVYRTRTPVAAE